MEAVIITREKKDDTPNEPLTLSFKSDYTVITVVPRDPTGPEI